MGQATIFLQPEQALGYWGYGQPADLETCFSTLLAQAGGHVCHSDADPSQGQSGHWAIASWASSPSQEATAPTAIVSFSAARQPHAIDAWVDIRGDRLLLEREAFGRFPLYWTQIDQVIWFASRFQLLLPILPQRQIEPAAAYGYSCFSYIPTPLTPAVGVFTIPAGTCQTWMITDGTIHSHSARSREWQESPVQLTDETVAVSQLQTLLKQAIHHQISDLSDQPVGVFLSGGLDSAIAAALLVQAGVKVRAYTLDFGATGIPEVPYAEQVANFLQIPLIRVDASPRHIRRALLPTVHALDLPSGDGVTVPLFLLGQAASQDVRIIFNGEGGDQLFAGWTNKPLIAAGIYQSHLPTEIDFTQQYLRTFHRLWGYEQQIFQPEIYQQIAPIAPATWIESALDPAFSQTLLHRLRRATLMLKGAQNIHPRATNLGRACGLGVRSPFCDLNLAQFAFEIAGELHLQGSCEKYLLKRAVEAWLPPEIVWRSKRGMGVPLTAWCLQDLWRDVGQWLNPAAFRQTGIWHPDLATRIAAGELGTIQGRRMGESLWLVLIWQVWHSTVWSDSQLPYSFDHPFWLPAWCGRQYLQYRRRANQ